MDINALGDTKPNPLTSQTKGSPVGSSYPLGLKTLNNRSHAFCTKTVIFLENCDHCGKRWVKTTFKDNSEATLFYAGKVKRFNSIQINTNGSLKLCDSG